MSYSSLIVSTLPRLFSPLRSPASPLSFHSPEFFSLRLSFLSFLHPADSSLSPPPHLEVLAHVSRPAGLIEDFTIDTSTHEEIKWQQANPSSITLTTKKPVGFAAAAAMQAEKDRLSISLPLAFVTGYLKQCKVIATAEEVRGIRGEREQREEELGERRGREKEQWGAEEAEGGKRDVRRGKEAKKGGERRMQAEEEGAEGRSGEKSVGSSFTAGA